MSREILFKGKCTTTGEWVEGDLLREKDYFGNILTKIYQIRGNGICEKHNVDPETVCQYTGLTDKNGRKIFEGDICDREEKFPEIVTYHSGDWTLDYSYASGKGRGYNYCNLGFYVRERGGVEVIGNIFDNPELLEGQVNK